MRKGTVTDRAREADLTRLNERRPLERRPFDCQPLEGMELEDLNLLNLEERHASE